MNSRMRAIAGKRKRANDARVATSIREVLGSWALTLVDVGAAGEIQSRWRPIASSLDYIGFEPDPRSLAQLMANPQQCRSYNIIPTALAQKDGLIDLTLCRKPTVSSVFPPNLDWLVRFPDASRFDVVSHEQLDAVSLDGIDLPNWFFMKMDVQGYELEILKGAVESLGSCLGLEVEVWFQANYIGQPLFGDVTSSLTDHDFEFIDFCSFSRWERHRHAGYGQLVWADALFLRSPEWILAQPFDEAMLRSYVAICCLYSRFDLIDVVLNSGKWKPDTNLLSAVEKLEGYFKSGERNFKRSARLMHQLSPGTSEHLLS